MLSIRHQADSHLPMTTADLVLVGVTDVSPLLSAGFTDALNDAAERP